MVGASAGFEAPCRARQQPLDAQPELLAERALAVEGLCLVAVAGEDDARSAVCSSAPSSLARSPARRPPPRARRPAGRRAADVGLAHRREHPRRLVRGGVAAAVEHHDAHARRTRAWNAIARPTMPPPTTATSHFTSSALRTSSPFAGMTRIRL